MESIGQTILPYAFSRGKDLLVDIWHKRASYLPNIYHLFMWQDINVPAEN